MFVIFLPLFFPHKLHPYLHHTISHPTSIPCPCIFALQYDVAVCVICVCFCLSFQHVSNTKNSNPSFVLRFYERFSSSGTQLHANRNFLSFACLSGARISISPISTASAPNLQSAITSPSSLTPLSETNNTSFGNQWRRHKFPVCCFPFRRSVDMRESLARPIVYRQAVPLESHPVRHNLPVFPRAPWSRCASHEKIAQSDAVVLHGHSRIC